MNKREERGTHSESSMGETSIGWTPSSVFVMPHICRVSSAADIAKWRQV
jgi:hypothetical protein